MDSRELAELQRLMKKASKAGLMDGGKMQSTLTQGFRVVVKLSRSHLLVP